MLEDSNTKVIVTHSDLQERFSHYTDHKTLIDQVTLDLKKQINLTLIA